MQLRPTTPDDLAAIQRIWTEVGWVEDDDEAAHIVDFLADADGLVATVDGGAEAAVTRHAGTARHGTVDLPLAAVTSVTTSRVARKRGLATRLTGRLLADAAADGAAVSMLGMFEQGFYDRLGFGVGAYEVFHRFDPATLRVDVPDRLPVRLGPDDAEEVAALQGRRAMRHGAAHLPSPGRLRAEMSWNSPTFNLGLRAADGRLEGVVGGSAKGEQGPYRVSLLAYESAQVLLELLGVLRTLGDQVRRLVLPEPPELQVQTLLSHPGRQWAVTRGGPDPATATADAWWQVRVLDLPACVAALAPREHVRCNLVLRDPLASHEAAFTDVDGEWVLDLHPDGATVERGSAADLPTLTASVGAFSRWWWGVQPAVDVALTDDLAAPPDLLAALDRTLVLPPPRTTLDF